MAQKEIFGTRCSDYSAWHRTDSIARFVGLERAQTLSMIDVDVVNFANYNNDNKLPLALVETAAYTGHYRKSAAVTKYLGMLAGLEAYEVFYVPSNRPNPFQQGARDIEEFHVKRLFPQETGWYRMSPERWAKAEVRMRERCAGKWDSHFARIEERRLATMEDLQLDLFDLDLL